jgi:hypothetical protein
MPKAKLSSSITECVQNCPQEETCYEFHKSSKAHPVLLVVFLESQGPGTIKIWNQNDHEIRATGIYRSLNASIPSIVRNMYVSEQQLKHAQEWQHETCPIQHWWQDQQENALDSHH